MELKKERSMEKYDKKVAENVMEMIRECLNNDTLKITLSSKLVEDLEVDSIDAICFIMELEGIYDVTIEDEKIETLTDVASIVKLLQEEINAEK